MEKSLLENLIHPEVQQFILDHESHDEKALLLKFKHIHNVPMHIIADQIAGRRKAKNKVPVLYQTKEIIYPPGINLEQSSSQKTASLKIKLLKDSGLTTFKQCVDLSGGFGIDSLYLSKEFETVHYVEPNAYLLEIVRHNHQRLGCTNIVYHTTTAQQFLEESAIHFDLLYADPSRRSENKKVILLRDCEPDMTQLMGDVFNHCNFLFIKTSPLLDIQNGLLDLKTTTKIFVISVDNECREVLFLCSKVADAEPLTVTINLVENTFDTFSFYRSTEKACVINYAAPRKYLYEPNTSILKAGAFKVIAQQYDLLKIHPSTHLYTSDKLVENFPGRVFEVGAVIRPDKKTAVKFFPELKANVITRNYPLTPEELKKKTGLSDGGDRYLIGFTGVEKKFVVVTNRIR